MRLRDVPVTALAFTNESRSLVACSYTDGLIQLCDRSSGSLQKSLADHSEYILGLLYSAALHRLVFTSAEQNGLRVWDVATGDCPFAVATRAECTAWAGNDFGRVAAAARGDRVIKIWSIVDG